MDRVESYVKNGIGFVLMNDPDHLNPLDIWMDDALFGQLSAYEADPSVQVIVLGGKGRAFSAGGDMRFFREQLDHKTYAELDAVLAHVNRLILLLKTMRKITVAAVQGHAAGGGACLMMAADFVIGDSTLRFSVPFTKIGLAPDAGCMYFLSRIVGPRRALEICTTNRVIGAEEAEALGLVNQVAAEGTALVEAAAYAERLAKGPLAAYELAKKQNFAVNYKDLEEYLCVTEPDTVGEAFRSHDFEESVRAFLEKRPPVYQGK